jgi:hypothetical protein
MKFYRRIRQVDTGELAKEMRNQKRLVLIRVKEGKREGKKRKK